MNELKDCRVVVVQREEFFSLFNKVLVDDQSSSPNYAAKSHVCVALCVCVIQMRVLSSGSFSPLPVRLFARPLSVTFCESSLFIELFDNAWGRVEALFLVGAPDRGAACLGSYPGEERGSVGTKRQDHPWGPALFSGWDEVSSGVICTDCKSPKHIFPVVISLYTL